MPMIGYELFVSQEKSEKSSLNMEANVNISKSWFQSFHISQPCRHGACLLFLSLAPSSQFFN